MVMAFLFEDILLYQKAVDLGGYITKLSKEISSRLLFSC